MSDIYLTLLHKLGLILCLLTLSLTIALYLRLHSHLLYPFSLNNSGRSDLNRVSIEEFVSRGSGGKG